VIPRYDAAHPDAPEPDRAFLGAVCRYLEPRRLVTTELVVRGPDYRDVWISLGIDAYDSNAFPEIREAVRAHVRAFLSPVGDQPWPLNKNVAALELQSVAARVPGVRLVRAVLLADGRGTLGDVEIAGIQLPRVAGISVSAGDPVPIDRLRGTAPEPPPPTRVVPVPVVPESC
jgi:hypothetical protein